MTKDKASDIAGPDQKDYFAQGGSWAQDRHDALRASRRIAWIVATVLGVVAVCEALALIMLTPLKTVEPYTLMVDRQTGFVQALKPLDPQLVSADRALTQSFLVQYVIAREEFDRDTVQADYRKVGLWSAGRARSDYVSAMQATNPDSPLVRYPSGTSVDVAVKSVTPMNDATAMVRFDTQRRDASAHAQPTQSWVAVIRYRYSDEPVGFQVERYRRSDETPPPAEPQPVSAAVGAAPMRPAPHAPTPSPAGDAR